MATCIAQQSVSILFSSDTFEYQCTETMDCKSSGKYGNRTLKNDRLSNYYKRSHSAQFYITKVITSGSYTLLSQDDTEELQEKFGNCFDDGGLDAGANCHRRMLWYNSSKVTYSLNKRKRWELPALLKENIQDTEIHEDLNFKVILTEHEVAGSVAGNAQANCIGVWNSKAAKVEKKPKKKYGKTETLLHEPKPSSPRGATGLHDDDNDDS
ncbi:uncharacterized protein LOC144433943 [Glandiceps talaboti]